MRELRVEDALLYLDQVKMEFGDRPHIYNEFLDIMKTFKSQQIDTPGVIERVSNLFHGNKKLVLGFNTFLPEGYKIELPMDGVGQPVAVYRAPGQTGVTQILGPPIGGGAGNLARGGPPPGPGPGPTLPVPQGGPPSRGAPSGPPQMGAVAPPAPSTKGMHTQAPPQHPRPIPTQAQPHPVVPQHPQPPQQQPPPHNLPPTATRPTSNISTTSPATRPPTSWPPHAPNLPPQPKQPPTSSTPRSGASTLPIPNETVANAAAATARARLAAAESQGRARAEQTQMQALAARNSQLPTTKPIVTPAQQPQQPQQLQPPGTIPIHQQPQPQQQPIPAALPQPPVPPPPPVVPSQQPPPQPQQPVEFDHAINYVTTIKKRFASQPDTYKNFLKILHTYQKEQRGIKEVLDEVSELFADHPDLLKEFTYFLPDAVQAQAKAQLEAVAKIAEDRKRRVAAAAARDVEERREIILKAKMQIREQKERASSASNNAAAAAGGVSGGGGVMPHASVAQQQGQVSTSPGGAPSVVSAVTSSAPPVTNSSSPPPSAVSASTASGSAGVVERREAAVFTPSQPMAPPPIPFGATSGRTEEREREICRSAHYGTVSFAPVRPPRKGELTPSQAAAKLGRPRAIPEPPMQPTAKEATFFQRAKAHLNRRELAPDKPAGSRRHTPHAEFLKCLHLFGAGILNREEILLLLRTLFMQGHAPKTGANAGGGASNPKVAAAAQELIAEFEAILIGRGPYANQLSNQKDKTKYGSMPIYKCDFNHTEHPTPSYRTHPADHPHKKFSMSGQTDEDKAVLNNIVVCVDGFPAKSGGKKGKHGIMQVVRSIEDYDGPKQRRNLYEELLFKIEDERFEMDMAIERNWGAMKVLEPMAEEALNLKETEERDGQPIGRMQYKLRQRSLGSNHIGAIARLYGDKGDEVVRHLLKNPVAVLPIVFKRLREKDVEWRKIRTEWQKQWRVVVEDNYEGSLDVLCYFYKKDVERSFATDLLIEECKRPKHYLKQSRKIQLPMHIRSITPTFATENPNPAYVFFQPHLKLKIHNSMPHKDAYNILFTHITKIAKNNNEKDKISKLHAEFVCPLFDQTIKYSVGQKVRTKYGDGPITSVLKSTASTSIRYKIEFSYGIGYIRPNQIMHSLPKSVVEGSGPGGCAGSSATVIDPDLHLLFGTEKIYLFMRLYCLMVNILEEARKELRCHNKTLSEKKTKVRALNIGTGATSVQTQQNQQLHRWKNYNGYQGLVTALQHYVKEELDEFTFETTCRALSKTLVFKLAALPKLLEKCAEAMLKVVREDVCLALFDYSQLPHNEILLLRTQSLNVTNDATYRIQYDSAASSMFFSFLSSEATLITTPKNSSISSGGTASAPQGISSHPEDEQDGMIVDDEDVKHHHERDHRPLTKRIKMK